MLAVHSDCLHPPHRSMNINNNNDANTMAVSTSKKYHKCFPDVPSLSSLELLRETVQTPTISSDNTSSPSWKVHNRRAIMVDVRSEPERNVSMIHGAITLHEFTSDVLPLLKNRTSNDCLPETVVLYCTIGYRSGIEAIKLQSEYPDLFHQGGSANGDDVEDRVRIANLDGIIPFANATTDNANANGLVVNPTTHQPTKRVHVYGPTWRPCLSSQFEPVVFSKLEFAWRGVGVVARRICMECSCQCWRS